MLLYFHVSASHDGRQWPGDRHDPLFKPVNFNLGQIPYLLESLLNECVDVIDTDIWPLEQFDQIDLSRD